MKTCLKCQTLAPVTALICHECGGDLPTKLYKFEVTFQFATCSPTVSVEATDETAAIVAARNAEIGEPVPEHIPATVRKIEHGGTRPGAGNPGTPRVAEPRNVRKYVRWAETEWEKVVELAKLNELSTADFIRQRVLWGS